MQNYLATPEDRRDIEVYVRATQPQHGGRPSIADCCNVAVELRVFEEMIRDFDVVPWLWQGCLCLQEWGDGVGFSFKPHAPSRGWGNERLVSELVAALEEAVARDAAEVAAMRARGEDVSATGAYTLIQIENTRAWLSQSTYAIWRRAQLLKDHLADFVRENALDYLETYGYGKDGPDVGAVADERWAAIMAAWLRDRARGVDRVLQGKDVP
jgi:hypothetical protein